MTLASDQKGDAGSLSPTARRMLALRDAVFGAWEERVRARVRQANELQHPILIDTLPVFYDNIVESISNMHPRTFAVDGSTVAAEHGGERARITSYDHAALIEEYQIFRATIFDVLHREGVALDHRETHAIHGSIDAGIQDAVKAFFLVHSGLRERFSAALAHDMRGPLTATMTALELILLSDDVTRIKAVAARALANTERMSGMVDELLHAMTFHGGQKIGMTLADVDIQDVVGEVAADAALAHGPRIRVRGGPVAGRWDRSAIKRALENLVTNAVKYGSPGTPITIRSAAIHGRLVLSVHNEGPPIPPDEQEGIFQMYQRTRSAQQQTAKGWGIGLPYVRAVAESHGGSVGLDSSAELGTTFVIDIPLDGGLKPDAPALERC